MGRQSCNSIYLLIPLWRGARVHARARDNLSTSVEGKIPCITIRYETCTYVVNNILLRVLVIRSWLVHRTYYVHLVVLERRVVLVYVYYVVCVVYSKSETENTSVINNLNQAKYVKSYMNSK